jgi:hypothetical protein
MTEMIKLTLAAVVAAFAFTGVADAAVVNRAPPPKINIPAPKTPAGPAQPTGSESTFSDENCTLEMGHLRLIRPAQIEEATYDGIFIQPICEGQDAGAAVRNAGNAGGLRPLLSTRLDVVEALAEQAYSTDEVVGVRFGGGDTLVLYVHHER